MTRVPLYNFFVHKLTYLKVAEGHDPEKSLAHDVFLPDHADQIAAAVGRGVPVIAHHKYIPLGHGDGADEILSVDMQQGKENVPDKPQKGGKKNG